MSSTAERVFNDAAKLSIEERAELAHKLIESLGPETEDEIDDAFDRELDRRYQAVRDGTAEWKPVEEAMAEIRAKLL